ncbi:MAG: ATP-binding cassette domain-containing protein, partial [Clostridia bacterium]|nr:ATP-binding cassette domain-containing protein [Clostridia bacterium]
MSDAILEVRHLKKYFTTPAGALHAVDDVSFTIEKGKTLGVVGESGCGKSTLGRTVLRLLPVTEGQVIYKGQDISNLSERKLKPYRRNMQIIFQDPY